LGDGVSGIIGRLECDNTRTLRAAIGRDVDIGAKHLAVVCSLTEQVLQVLPANIVGKLHVLSV
jgi:hypothetical protein